MATVRLPKEQRLVLPGVSWRTYERLLRVFEDRRLRITYDRGALEIMTLSPEHERRKHLLRRLLEALIEELGWHVAGFGSMTFKRRAKQRGLEPDECYWIQNEPQVRGQDHIDLRHDPPPDVVLEIEVSRSALDRLSIYAALNVPEIWRYDGRKLSALLLGPDGKYTESDRSAAFPFLSLADLVPFLDLRTAHSETDLIREFRTWVRDRIAAGWQ